MRLQELLDVHEDKLTDEFNRANNFQTSIRGEGSWCLSTQGKRTSL